MLIDRKNLVSYKQAITASAVSTDFLDLGAPMWTGTSGNDHGVPLFFAVDQAFTAAGAATLEIQLQSAKDTAFSVNLVTHWSSGPIAKTQLGVPGRLPLFPALPPDVQQYVRANYIVATGPMTAGQLTVGVTASKQTNF